MYRKENIKIMKYNKNDDIVDMLNNIINLEDISKAELARRIGISPQGLNAIFTKKNINLDDIKRIADALGLEIEINLVEKDRKQKNKINEANEKRIDELIKEHEADEANGVLNDLYSTYFVQKYLASEIDNLIFKKIDKISNNYEELLDAYKDIKSYLNDQIEWQKELKEQEKKLIYNSKSNNHAEAKSKTIETTPKDEQSNETAKEAPAPKEAEQSEEEAKRRDETTEND